MLRTDGQDITFFVADIPYVLGTDSDLNSLQRQYRHEEKEKDYVSSY